MKSLYIDRFEDGVAVLVDGDKSFNYPVSMLPTGATAGDWITIAIDTEKGDAARAEVGKLMGELTEL